MPQIEQKVTTEQTVLVLVAQDAAGAELRIGDEVSLRLKVTGIRPKTDPETDKHVGDDVELDYVKDNGYHLHLLTIPADMVRKA